MTNPREFVFVLSGDASGIEGAARRGQAAINSTAESTTALEAAQKRATNSSDSLAASLLATGTGGFLLSKIGHWAMEAARALTEAQIRADRLMLQLSAGAGAANAGRELAYVREVSNTLGLELNTTAQSYARLAASARGTSMEGQGARQVFDSVAKAAAVMGLNVEESQGVLRALEQMMSKGTVQAEELRGQLGDRLPGALQIAARALGVTTGELSKMVERGEVIASEFLPRFAKQLELELGSSAEKAADTMQAATNRASNSWDLLLQTVAQAGAGDFIKGQLNILADGVNNISEAMTRARERGSGFTGQMTAAAGAALQFANPLNAIAYNASSAAGELQQAKEKVAALKAELVTNPGNIFLRPAIQETEELIEKLERARQARINLRAVDNATLLAAERQEGEARARRIDALRKVTDELAGANSKLAQTQRTLAASFTAGDIDRGEYERLVNLARRELGPKAEKPGKAAPLSDQLILDVNDARARQFERFAEADAKTRDFMLDQVQRSDERVLAAYERRKEQGLQMAEQLRATTDTIEAGLLKNPQARGEALIAVERAQLTSRLALLKLNAEDRKAAEDEIVSYVAMRHAQLTEELKPEWQKMLEAWEDTQQGMKRASDDFLLGFVNEGRSAFNQFAMTGRISVSGLVDFVRAEFARMVYDRYLSQMAAGLGSSIFGAIFGGGLNVDTGGFGIGQSSGIVGLPTRGGAATGTNFVERDMLTILHKGEAVIPKAYNPSAGGAGSGVVIHQTFNVQGGSRADVMAAAQAGKEAAVAEISELMRRGNPAFA